MRMPRKNWRVGQEWTTKPNPWATGSWFERITKTYEICLFGWKLLQSGIINSSLSNLEEEKLLMGLSKNNTTLGWSIEDLKGISPAYCMPKINDGGRV